MQKGDIVIAIPGSGTIDIVVQLGMSVTKLGLKLITIASNIESPMTQISDSVILIPGKDE